ncbi:unnamed protein product, partial [Candidula unifasciata]
MIIEQVDALKVWLTNKLSPICDAEPSALAKYVCALVKKDKHEQDLRDICVDQLDVFLQQNTKPFVDELFEVLKTKIYIPPVTETKPRPPPPIAVVKADSKSPSHQAGKEKDDGQKKKVSEISSTTDDKENKDTSVTAPEISTTVTLSNVKEPTGESRTIKDPPREVREPRATSRDARDKERDEELSRDRRDSWKDDRSREGIRDSRDRFRDSRDGIRDARDIVRDGRDGIRDTREGFRDARDGIKDSRDGLRDSRDGVKDAKEEIRDARDIIKDSKDGIRDSREGIRDSKDGTKDSREGIRDLRDGNRDLRDGNRDTKDGIRDSRDSVKDTRDGIRETKDGIRDARDIIRDRERDKLDLKQDTREVREPRDRDFRDRDRDRDFRRRRSRSRSYSPRRRDFDADRRRRFEERPRYSPDRRWGRRRSYSRSPRRNRSPLDRNIGRARSRSPRVRSRSPRYRPFKSRTRSRSRSPRHRSWSRPGSGIRTRTKSPSNTRQPDSRGSTPLQDNDFISSSTNDLPTVTSIVGYRPLGEDRVDGRLPPVHFDGPPPAIVHGGRVHCQNFEEKGFCMLGDVCPYDHGSDPVVLEDMSIPSVLPGAPNTGGFVPPDMRVPPPGHPAVRMNLQRPPPLHVEPYLPEAPGLNKLPYLRLPPPDLRQPPPGLLHNRPPPQADHFYMSRREVVINHPPPLLDDGGDLIELATTAPDKEPSRIVIPAKRPYSAISSDPNAVNIGPPPPRMALVNQTSLMFENAPLLQPPFPNTDPASTQALPMPRPQFRPSGSLTLEVWKIPHEYNNIAKLNEHFGKFGNLTNIQVKFQGDPGAALITYSNSSEANAAYRSPEPVFNNRFIKLFWHNAEKQINLDGETDSPVVVTVGEDGRNVQIQQTTVTGGRVGDGIDHPPLMLPVRPSIPPAHKLQLDNTKAKPNSSTPLARQMRLQPTLSIVYTSSIGNLKKTVFNPSATTNTMAKSKSTTPIVSPTAMKTADHVSRMEAISRIEEERKLAAIKQAELEQKRQELLAKQIQQQKILLDTLEKKKATMSEEEKKDLWKALRTISDAIDKVKYSTGAKRPQPTTFQPPAPDQFKYVSSHEQ